MFSLYYNSWRIYLFEIYGFEDMWDNFCIIHTYHQDVTLVSRRVLKWKIWHGEWGTRLLFNVVGVVLRIMQRVPKGSSWNDQWKNVLVNKAKIFYRKMYCTKNEPTQLLHPRELWFETNYSSFDWIQNLVVFITIKYTAQSNLLDLKSAKLSAMEWK
jgi:hypothetical protein